MNYSWNLLEFDTALFGYNIAKITSLTDGSGISLLLDELKQQHIQYASCRISTDKALLIESLQKHSFRLVDGLVAMEINLSNSEPLLDSIHCRKAVIKDRDSLFAIASESFVNNRFYQDTFFADKKDKIKSLYGKWADNSLKGEAADAVFVYETDGVILGFITLQDSGHIPLLAVSENARGRGIAKSLVQQALEYFKEKRLRKVAIETVIMNVPALRSYQTMGFKIVQTYFTFAWHNDDTHILH
jgi:ribosomal protein S18 acetylase RimI-like enzyme